MIGLQELKLFRNTSIKGNNNKVDNSIVNYTININSYENTNYNILKDKLNKCIEKVKSMKLNC